MLFEDQHLLALDKPAGLLTSPDRYDPNRPNLMKLLHTGMTERKSWARERRLEYLMVAHRLDFETSGVILMATSKPVLVKLANLFGSEMPRKRFVTLAQGAPKENSFEVNASLSPHLAQPGLFRVDRKRGKRAVTRVEVLERFAGWTLLRCELLTERPHQVRVHLRHIGLAIVGAGAYGGRPLYLSTLKRAYRLKPKQTERPLLSRVALHAEQLILPHPETGETITVTAPWPKDLTVAVKYLRRYAQ